MIYLLWNRISFIQRPQSYDMSIFRNTVWFLKGMREYTASGYTAASASFNPKDLDVNCEVSLVSVLTIQ